MKKDSFIYVPKDLKVVEAIVPHQAQCKNCVANSGICGVARDKNAGESTTVIQRRYGRVPRNCPKFFYDGGEYTPK